MMQKLIYSKSPKKIYLKNMHTEKPCFESNNNKKCIQNKKFTKVIIKNRQSLKTQGWQPF